MTLQQLMTYNRQRRHRQQNLPRHRHRLQQQQIQQCMQEKPKLGLHQNHLTVNIDLPFQPLQLITIL